MNTTRKLWIGLLVLAVLAPLGVLLPHYLKAGSAWGEWSPDEVREQTGAVPAGMARQADQWHAPMPDYSRPGEPPAGLVSQSVWYVVSALAGISVVAGLSLLLGRWLARNERNATHVDD